MFLSLVFHNHQPVGQLPWVFDDSWRDSYNPFLDVLEAHPQIKVALHYTGPLLDWLQAHKPETIARVRKLVQQGQVEVLGGGFYEPILAIWPHDDQTAQLSKLSERVLELFGQTPHGMWLAERVWEPSLINPISQSKLDYTFVDSTVLGAAGIVEDASFGSFRVSNREENLTIFPINQELRHHIPWHEAEESIDYLRGVHERIGANSLAVFADDGEKFGGWPGTFDFVYTRGWLDKFFAAIEANNDWLQTITPHRWTSTHEPLRDIELPSGSYSEMQNWSRGNWRNFLSMYRESRDIHEEVMRVREIVRAKGNQPAALDNVLQAQSNDALWHGAFGGLYLRHLRQASYARTTEAQVLAEGKTPFTRVEIEENGDALLENERIKIGVRPDDGSIFNWTSKAARHNALSTLRRYREGYHTPSSPQDWYSRGALIDHFFGEDTTIYDFAQSKFSEQGDFASEEWQLQLRDTEFCACIALQREGGVWSGGAFRPVVICKTLRLHQESDELQIEYSICNASDAPISLWWAHEWNIAMSGVDTPTRHYHATDNTAQLRLDEEREFDAVTNPQVGDNWLQLVAGWKFAQPLAMWHVPICTISQKEDGAIERVHQSSAFVWHQHIQLAPREAHAWEFTASLHSKRDL